MNHFIDAEARGDATRAIVFSEYRDSAEEIVRALNIHKPMISATVFVGQADSKRSAGMKQSEQIETVEQFKKGRFNVLVATSIGEEGLDIGQVDLIVCYDASSSPIRMLQRMGRTGRKREGHVVLLLMNGKEADSFARARDNYEHMQKTICEGSRFNFRHDLSPRIIPRHIRPEVDKQLIHIPVENTQNTSLPEPGKRRTAPKGKKVPPKKFHMPDGVITGFMKASDIGKPGSGVKRGRPKKNQIPQEPPKSLEMDELAEVPPLEEILLNAKQMAELDRSYRSLPGRGVDVQEAEPPSLSAFPRLQRVLRPVGKVKHGKRSERFTKLMRTLTDRYCNPGESWVYPYGEEDTSRWRELPAPLFARNPEATAPTAKDNGTTEVLEATDDDESFRAQHPPPPPKKRKTNATTRTVEDGVRDSAFRPKKPRAPKKSRKKAAPKQRGGINSDEVGDDCERDSDMPSTDGSDRGSDLEDFVNDGPVTSPPPSTLPSSAGPSPLSVRCKDNTATRSHPLMISSQISSTQESIGDLPSVDALIASQTLGKRRSRLTDFEESEDLVSESGQDDEDEDLPQPKAKGRARRGRGIFGMDDSEDEEYP